MKTDEPKSIIGKEEEPENHIEKLMKVLDKIPALPRCGHGRATKDRSGAKLYCPNCEIESLQSENSRLSAENQRLTFLEEVLRKEVSNLFKAAESERDRRAEAEKENQLLRDEMKAILAEIKSSGTRHSLVYGKPEKFISLEQIEEVFTKHGVKQ